MLYLMIDYVKKDFPYSKLSMIIGVILVLISLASINLYSDSHAERKMKALKKLYDAKESLFTLDDPEQLLKYSPKYNQIIKKS